MSDQLSAISLNRGPRARLTPKGTRSTGLSCVLSWVPVWRKPEHRKALGERPEGGADRMSAPDLRGRMPRKISAGPKARGAQGWVAPSGAAFLLVTFLWPRKEKSPAVGQPPTSTRRPQGGSTRAASPAALRFFFALLLSLFLFS